MTGHIRWHKPEPKVKRGSAAMSSIGSMLTSLNRKVNPISRRLGGRKFFLPRTIKEPTVRYSPVGAVLATCKLTANKS